MNLKAVELIGYLKAWADVNERRSDTSCYFELMPLPSSDFLWLHHCVTGQMSLPKGLALKESTDPEQLLSSALAEWLFFEIPVMEDSKATLSMHLPSGREWRIKHVVANFREAFGVFRFMEIEQTEFLPNPKTGRIPFMGCLWNEYVLVAEDSTQWFLHFSVSD